MNKTLTINLSGLVFHIDENAYEVLRNYLERLKRRFTGSSGDEIITDIEGRIAEMFQEKISPAKNVITIDDVNSVISIMGNPEDIAGEETDHSKQEAGPASYTTTGNANKRLFRNPDNKMLAGVCGGIGAYFDIDPVWLRLAFAFGTIISVGTGAVLYIVLWIVIPMAKTASEKLEMRGEPVNISNLEKNIREEMQNVKEQMNKLGNEIGSHATGAKVKYAASRVGGLIGDILKYIFKFLTGILGFFFTVFSIFILILLSVLLFSVFGWIPTPADGPSYTYIHYIVAPQNLWLLIIGVVLLVGVPFVVLMLNGIKLLFRAKMDLKRFGAVMLAFWLLGIGLCVWQGVTVGRQFNSKATVSHTEIYPAFKNRIIHLGVNKISTGRFEWRDDDDRIGINGGILIFTSKPDSIMCNNIRLTIDQSRCDSVYLIRSNYSRGVTTNEAQGMAQNLNYFYSKSDSSIILNNAFNIQNAEKYRGQSIRLTLKIPVGYKIVLDKSMREMEYDGDNLSDVSHEDMAEHTWEMTKDGLKCLDCPAKEKKTENKENADTTEAPNT